MLAESEFHRVGAKKPVFQLSSSPKECKEGNYRLTEAVWDFLLEGFTEYRYAGCVYEKV